MEVREIAVLRYPLQAPTISTIIIVFIHYQTHSAQRPFFRMVFDPGEQLECMMVVQPLRYQYHSYQVSGRSFTQTEAALIVTALQETRLEQVDLDGGHLS